MKLTIQQTTLRKLCSENGARMSHLQKTKINDQLNKVKLNKVKLESKKLGKTEPNLDFVEEIEK